MSLQLFDAALGYQIDETGAIISGTGIPGSGTNDSVAQTVEEGAIYIRTGTGSAEFYQKISSGATPANWTRLAIEAEVDDLDELRTLTGTSVGDTDLGTGFNIIENNETIRGGLEDLDTSANNILTALGISNGDTDFGSFSGGVLSDNAAAKALFQELETYAEQTRSLVNKLEWANSVLDKDLTAPPVSPTLGDRYLLGTDTTASIVTGAWAGQDGNFAEWNGSAWDFTAGTLGTFVAVDDEPTVVYQLGGTTWEPKEFENTTASNGLIKVGNNIEVSPSLAGDGLDFTAGVMSVKVDNATIEIDTDALQVKADGINDTHIDFGLGANQVNLADLPYENTTSGMAATDGQAAIDELDNRVDSLEAASDSQVNTLGNTGGSTVTAYSVLVDEIAAWSLQVYIQEVGSDDTRVRTVDALHNGRGVSDATNVRHNEYGRLNLGGIAGLSIDVVITGTGAAQEMQLLVTANNDFDVRVVPATLVSLT